MLDMVCPAGFFRPQPGFIDVDRLAGLSPHGSAMSARSSRCRGGCGLAAGVWNNVADATVKLCLESKAQGGVWFRIAATTGEGSANGCATGAWRRDGTWRAQMLAVLKMR
jgi:hypothetical protein